MTNYQLEIASVRVGDLATVIRMTHENMIGVDREFTRLVSHRMGRWFSYLMLPINLLFEGYGFKVVYRGKMVGCAYLNLRKRSGYAYNVSVLRPYRRHGAGGLLMKHLEEMALDSGRHWMVLQVDEGNIPALNLYNSLGYKAYHPRYFGGTVRDLILTDELDRVSLERVSSGDGRRLFSYYLDIERVEGDPWASYVIDDLIPVQNLEGSYLRCLAGDGEIGCIRWMKKDRHLQIEIALKSDQWGNRAAPNAVSKILGESVRPLSTVNVNLGSSRHHDAGKGRFEKMGFRERSGARFFMLKRIERRE